MIHTTGHVFNKLRDPLEHDLSVLLETMADLAGAKQSIHDRRNAIGVMHALPSHCSHMLVARYTSFPACRRSYTRDGQALLRRSSHRFFKKALVSVDVCSPLGAFDSKQWTPNCSTSLNMKEPALSLVTSPRLVTTPWNVYMQTSTAISSTSQIKAWKIFT